MKAINALGNSLHCWISKSMSSIEWYTGLPPWGLPVKPPKPAPPSPLPLPVQPPRPRPLPLPNTWSDAEGDSQTRESSPEGPPPRNPPCRGDEPSPPPSPCTPPPRPPRPPLPRPRPPRPDPSVRSELRPWFGGDWGFLFLFLAIFTLIRRSLSSMRMRCGGLAARERKATKTRPRLQDGAEVNYLRGCDSSEVKLSRRRQRK